MWKIVILTLLWCNWSFSIQFLCTIQHWTVKIPCSKSLFVGVWYKEGKEDTTQNFWALSRFCVLSHSIYNMNCEALWQVLIKGTQQALNLVLSTFPPGVIILNFFLLLDKFILVETSYTDCWIHPWSGQPLVVKSRTLTVWIELSVIPGIIQMKWFIPVECRFGKKSNTFWGIPFFSVLPKFPEISVAFVHTYQCQAPQGNTCETERYKRSARWRQISKTCIDAMCVFSHR